MLEVFHMHLLDLFLGRAVQQDREFNYEGVYFRRPSRAGNAHRVVVGELGGLHLRASPRVDGEVMRSVALSGQEKS